MQVPRRHALGRTAALAALSALALACAQPGAAQAFDLGFNGEDLLQRPNGAGAGATDEELAVGLANAKTAGATVWRMQLAWSDIAPDRPGSDGQAADPASPAYRWTSVDRKIRAIAAAGLSPLVWINRAPAWAEGPARPAITRLTPAGSWRPSAPALRLFASALATRYSGAFPDPLAPDRPLPAVTNYQGWNEPNLYVEVTPQYVPGPNGPVNTSAGIFRSLLNAIYDGVKSANPKATVLAGATAPFGDYPAGGARTPPAAFWREVLCISAANGTLTPSKNCPQVRFDGFSHNPYSISGPRRGALNPDDVTVPDLGRISDLVQLGVNTRTIQPARKKPLWITELAWDSAPDPRGLSPEKQAEYIQGAFSLLWRQGAQTVLYWNSRDDSSLPSFEATYQSGIFFRGVSPSSDVKKPSWTAFRFPFTAYRKKARALLWGKAPAPGPVVIQRRSGARWVTFARLTAGADGVFAREQVAPRAASLRAVQGSASSLTWNTNSG